MDIFLVSVCTGLVIFSLCVIIFTPTASENDIIKGRLRSLGSQVKRKYVIEDEELSKPLYERLVKPFFQSLGKFFGKIIPAGRSGASDEKLKKQLEQAGFSISAEDYKVLQFVIMIGCAIAGIFLGAIMQADAVRIIMFAIGGAFCAYAIIRYYVSVKVTSRQAAIEGQLPDMLDLLSVSVEAGLGFERALQHVTENLDGPLIDELTVTYREMSLGLSRKEAMTLLGERCAVEDVVNFTSAVVQAGQLGIPIKNVLKSQAAAIRRSRKAKIQEKAAKVSTKILIPMLLFIFPVLFIVLLGPSVITIMEQFG